jgi:VIT1/CCC1 family predicted Fe2+/Mn2+ transporter
MAAVQPGDETPSAQRERHRRVLDPSERTAEVLFGLIMVLTFTGSLSVAEAGRDDIRTMLVGALGCNLAWGIIDGVLYLMGCLADRSRNVAVYHAVRGANDASRAHALIAEELPPVIASAFQPADFERIRQRMRAASPPAHGRWTASDWTGALAVCLLVFLSTFPVALPFVIMQDASRAMRVSNAVAVVMLFVVGVAYGRSVRRSPWIVGMSMVLLGAVLVALTMALGG